MERIMHFYENLSMKNKIIILLIGMLIMFICIVLMRNEEIDFELYSDKIDYKNVNIETLIQNFSENYSNRDDYGVVKNIISDLRYSYQTSDKKIDAEYYSIIDKNYSKYLRKNDFKEKINNIFYRIEENGNYDIKLYKENDSSNIYIVELVCEETIGYIGIQLDWDRSQYYVFYLQ